MRSVFSSLALVAFTLGAAAPLGAQVVRGAVLDVRNGRPVPMAAVQVMSQERDAVAVAMTDSVGRYAFAVPAAGEYILLVQRFGYRDLVSPLLAISDARDYALDLELEPEPLGLGELTVTVRNEQAEEWVRREFGRSPQEFFGFRLLQGERLAEAKAKGRFRPTETLRWLYVPVSHGLDCVAINAFPRASTTTSRGPRAGAFAPGAAPGGTRDVNALRQDEAAGPDLCGRLLVNDRMIPNEHLDSVNMGSIAVVITLPGEVRMYTYDFDWRFREE